MNETERRYRLSYPAGGSIRLWLIALAALVVVAFGFGPAVSSAPAKGGAEVTPKVIGGTVAPDGSWSSQAALLRSSEADPNAAQFCGGTLIDRYWVLTAAHCMFWPEWHPQAGQPLQPSDLDLAIGINDLGSIAASNRHEIASIRVIPEYNPTSRAWDFALLELRTPSAQPTMEMITPSQVSLTAGGQPAAVAGWGCTSQTAGECNPGGYPVELRQANVDFISDATCESGSSYGGLLPGAFVSAVMICAGVYPAGTRDTCFGDSGGPLVAFATGGEKVLAGVTSWGYECALPNYPGVYAKVMAGRDWILRTIEENPRQGPTVSLKAKPPKRTHSRKATFRFKASQSGSTFKCRIDGKSWQKCKSPRTYQNLKRGRNHTFRVKATKGGITGPVKKHTWNVKRH